jgi:hypothetical protein
MFFQGAGLKLRKLVIKNATYKHNHKEAIVREAGSIHRCGM